MSKWMMEVEKRGFCRYCAPKDFGIGVEARWDEDNIYFDSIDLGVLGEFDVMTYIDHHNNLTFCVTDRTLTASLLRQKERLIIARCVGGSWRRSDEILL